MRLRHLVVCALALGSLATASGPARAEAPGPNALPVQVVAIKSDDAEDQAEALTSALRSAVRGAKGWSLPDGDFSLEVISLALKCGEVPDAACQGKIADHIKAERYVWGTLKRVKGTKQVVADLHLFQRGQPSATAEYTYSDNLTEPGDESLKKVASEAVGKLTGGLPKGSVHLKTSLAAGDIFVDGQASGSVKNGEETIQLSAGEHKIEVRGVQGKETGLVTVRPAGSVDIVLAPVAPPPGATAQGEVDLGTKPPAHWKKTAGYVGVGVGGALVLGGLYSVLKVSSIQNDSGYDNYRKGFHSGQDVCDEAAAGHLSAVPGAASPTDVQDMCNQGKTFKTLQFVFFGAGAVALGAGVYFLVTADKDAPPATASVKPGRVQVLPAFGPGVAAVDMNVAF